MISIYNIKPAFQNLLRPSTHFLAKKGVTANMVTISAMVGSILLGGIIYLWPYKEKLLFLLPIWLVLRMALNAIDGMLAREHNMKTSLGCFLNEIGDVISDAALYLPLALIPGVTPGWVVTAVVLAIVSEMTGLVGQVIGKSRRYDGPMGKSDRAFVFGGACLILGFDVYPGYWFLLLMVVVNFLLVLTIRNRLKKSLTESAL